MKLLNKLTLKNLKLNRKRTIVTIIGIILSVSLITAVSSMVVSFKKSLIKYETSIKGNYHYGFINIKSDDLSYFTNNNNIEDYYITKNVGYAKLEASQNDAKPYAYILGVDSKKITNMGLTLIEGKMPEKYDEIVIPRHLKTNGRVDYKVGETILLNVGKRLSDDYELFQSNPFTSEQDEKIDISYAKEYKIVGIIERPSTAIEPYSAPGYTFITYIDNNLKQDATYNIYTRYKSDALKDRYKITANILGVNEELFEKTKGGEYIPNIEDMDKFSNEMENAKYKYCKNQYLITLETMSFQDDSTMQTIITLAGIVIAIIIFTSVFCIKNSFDISITEKVKQYGMLASIGATGRQIKKNVYYEAFLLGIIGIPLGILFGIIAAFVLIQITNYLLKEAISFDLIFDISILSIAISILLSVITIYFSARKSAKKASKISPIVAIRSNEDIKIKAKKIKSPKIIKMIFGVGGDVAYKNLKRNKKKYRTTIISIIVCVSVYIALSYFINLAFNVVKMEYGEYNYNLSVSIYSNEYQNNIEDANKIIKLENINKYSLIRNTTFNLKNAKYTSEHVRYDMLKNEVGNEILSVISLGEQEYNNYLKNLNLRYEEAKDKAILINNSITYYEIDGKYKKVEYDILDYKNKDKIKGQFYDNSKITQQEQLGEEKEIEIIKVTSQRPMGYENKYGMSYIVVSDEYMDSLDKRSIIELYIDSQNADAMQDKIHTILESEYSINNIDNNVKQVQSLYTLIAIFLYGFIIVIALIGITNIFNTITTNMELRSREFAMLKSIGMTNKEFNKMIWLESFFYGMKSLIIGIPIGIGLSYILYKVLIGEIMLEYIIPLKGIIISIVIVFALLFCIMRYSINKIKRKNIIETIRKENI